MCYSEESVISAFVSGSDLVKHVRVLSCDAECLRAVRPCGVNPSQVCVFGQF